MRKIIFIFLVFCLAITTVLAQVVTFDIATSDNGLSNNQVSDFDVNTDGTILNNSASDGTAQLGSTAVTANPNITAGSEASLILLQVTGSSGSNIYGTIEVFGAEAGLIIANPNGIACDGCGFINTSKVDLVTGTSNFSGTDLTGFSIDDTSNITVSGNGFVDDAVADELNLASRYLKINAPVEANNSLRGLTGNITYDHILNVTTSDTSETSAHSINISPTGSLEANSIELINTELSSNGSHGIVNNGGNISAGELKIDSNGLFRNQESGGNFGNIDVSGLLEVTNAERFINNANITADTLTIATNEFFNNYNGLKQLGKIFVTDIFSLSTTSYTNTGTVTSDSLNLTIGGNFSHESTTLNNFTFNNLNLNVGGDYSYNRSADDLFDSLDNLVVSGNADIITNNYIQYGVVDVAGELNISSSVFIAQNGSTIDAATFELTGTGIFQNGATVTATNGKINTNGVFNNTSFGIFNISNNLDITANNFSNLGGDLNVDDTLTVKLTDQSQNTFGNFVGNFVGNINVGTFNLSVADDFNYNTDFLNNGNITKTTLNLNVGGNFVYPANTGIGLYIDVGGSLVVDGDIDVTAPAFSTNNNSLVRAGGDITFNGDDFINASYATIEANNFNVILTNEFGSSSAGVINVTNNFDITANNLVNTGDIIVGGDLIVELTSGSSNSFDNVHPNVDGDITADTFSLSVAHNFDYLADFLNNGNIDIANNLDFTINGNFTNTTTIVPVDSLGITANNITNDGTIDPVTSLTINARNLIQNDGTITGTSLTINTENLIQNDGTITGTFLTINSVNDITNNGNIDPVTSLTINAGNLIQNDGAIDTNILTIDTDAIHNPGNITANTSLTITATNDVVSGGNIITDDLNIGTGSNFANQGDITAYTSLTVNAGNLIQNDGTIDTDILTIDTDAIHNPGNITANTSLTINATNDVFSGGSIITGALNIDANRNFANHGDISGISLGITAGYTAINQGSIASSSLDINTDDFFRNLIGGEINVITLNITAGGKVTNIATINAGTLNIIANNDSSRTDDTTGFYVANRGNITATDLNIAAVDNFYNRGNVTAETLDIEAKDIFLLNKEIDSFVGTYDGGNIYLTGDSSFVAADGIIENYGNIDLVGNNLDITADSFINHEDANVTADTLNLTVNSFIDEGSITATIDATIDQ